MGFGKIYMIWEYEYRYGQGRKSREVVALVNDEIHLIALEAVDYT
jgi:hypothetical protein